MEKIAHDEVSLTIKGSLFPESVVWENGKMYLHSGDYHKYITDELLSSMSDDKRDEVIMAMGLLISDHQRPEPPISSIYGYWD